MKRKSVTKFHFVTDLVTDHLTHEKLKFLNYQSLNRSLIEQLETNFVTDIIRGEKSNVNQNWSINQSLIQ